MTTTNSRLVRLAAAGAAGIGLATANVVGQVSIAWTGAGDGTSWSDPNNWDPAVVPDNGAATYNVTLDLTGNVFLDLDIACTIDDLILGANHTLKINPGHSLTVLDDAFLDGAIEVQNASFLAASPGASFGSANRSRLLAQGGGLIRIGATNYSSSGLVGTATLFSAHGAGSMIDLSTLQSVSTGFNDGCCAGTNVHSIVASADGIVDLSGVQTLLGPVNAEDRLDIVLGTDGQVLLPALQEIGSTSAGDVRFVINVPDYTFPSLLAAADFDLLPGVGTVVFLPLLETLAKAEIVVPNDASVSMPSVLSITGSSISVAAGGSLSAPAASDFTGNTITIDSGQALDFPLFATIDNSRFVVQGGSVLEVAATSYSSSGLASTQTIIGAEGAGTLVDWSTVQSIDAGFNDGCCAGTNVHTVSASAGAVIDLSSLQFASGPVNAEDRLEFKVASGGDIVLDALQEVDSIGAGDVRFSIEVPSFALPSLFSASDVDLLPAAGSSLDLPSLALLNGAEVVVPSGATVLMPAVVGISNSTISVGTGGTFYAPAAASFTGNVVTFDSGQIMTLPVLGSIDASRFAVTGGSMLVVAATSYSSASLAST
ncbi:MAG: hypothetical protein KDA22_04235, partial [Phycisphaerales bacterium]|nr:hypothetical protein [Phycisphaerales bacterium]